MDVTGSRKNFLSSLVSSKEDQQHEQNIESITEKQMMVSSALKKSDMKIQRPPSWLNCSVVCSGFPPRNSSTSDNSNCEDKENADPRWPFKNVSNILEQVNSISLLSNTTILSAQCLTNKFPKCNVLYFVTVMHTNNYFDFYLLSWLSTINDVYLKTMKIKNRLEISNPRHQKMRENGYKRQRV